MKRLLFALALLGMLMLAGCMAKSHTLDAMIQAFDAVNNENWQQWNAYVDTDALIEQAVDLTIDEVKKQAGQYGGLVDLVGGLAKPTVIKTTRKEFKKLLTSGKLKKSVPGMDLLPSSELLFNLVHVLGVPETDDDNYRINEVRELNNGELLDIEIKIKNNKPWLPLKIESKKAGDHYRITRIRNLKKIYKRLL